MFIDRSGSGPRAFLGLHGWSGDHHTFDPLTAQLPCKISFFGADLPGCGHSPSPRQWTLEAIADEIAEAAQRLPKPLTIVGNCSGALLALLLAQRLGDHVDRLVLLDLFAVFPWYFRVFLHPVYGRYAYWTAFANPLGRAIGNASLKRRRSRDSDLTAGFARVDHAATLRYLQIFDGFPQPEHFRDLTQAVDLIYGGRTFAAARNSSPRWQAVWPQARVWTLADAGHLPIREATVELSRIIFQERGVPIECPVSPSISAH